MKITISLSEGDYALVQVKAKEDMTSPLTTAATIINVWCSERRAERRYRADPGHYEARNGSDFEEVV